MAPGVRACDEEQVIVRSPSYEPGSVIRIRGTAETAVVLRVLGDEQAEVPVGGARQVAHVAGVEPVGGDGVDRGKRPMRELSMAGVRL